MTRFSATYLHFLVSAMMFTTTAGCLDQSSDPGDNDKDKDDVSVTESALIFTGVRSYDAGTQCTVGGATMHCCPIGYTMIGAHVDNNVFKCAQLYHGAGFRFLDVGTQRNGMHACPYGAVMAGLHVDRNYLACQYPIGGVASEYVDRGTQDGYPMHVCGSSQDGMSGIHVDQNKFTCAR